MNIQSHGNADENGVYDSSNINDDADAERRGIFGSMVDGNMQSLVEWLNRMVPHLTLPLEATKEELRACLMDGTVLCSLLNNLSPGSIEMGGNCEPGPATLGKFLAAMDEMGLTRFVLADIQQGYMVPVLQCLGSLKSHFDDDGEKESIHNEHKFSDALLLKQRCYADLSDANILELMRNGLDNASTQTLFSLLDSILDESIKRKNGHVHHQQLVHILRKVVHIIQHRVSNQAENLKNQNNLFKVRTEKYQSRIRVLETIAAGTTEEIEVLLAKLQQIKIEKTELKERGKLEEQDLIRLKEQKNHSDIENLKLRQELGISKGMHKEHCLLLESQAEETKLALEKKLKELECFLIESRKKVKDLESCSESKSQRWRKKEGTYKSFIDYQSRALQDLRAASESVKHEILKTKRSYSEEFYFLGVKLKGLVDAAKNYHVVLAENRKLYNEVQDLKGNIRVYCRIRPFLPGQCKKQTTIEYIGDNGELVISNPSKQAKDSHRLFKFNKVFGPATTQEEVFVDTQPLIRSVLDGYNVCIFAYGQTGSGKTYTMSGPNMLSQEDWGVNYRALHDLFQISQSRKGSIKYEVGVQMVEIYNEQVRDLLTSDGSQKRLGIWSTAQPNGLAVPEASLHPVRSTADVLEYMNIGLMNRAVGATALNERSSRSHSILTVHVYGAELETGAILRGSLHLVDLAGSERVDRSEATGDRLREAQHINKSLSALGDVIFALAQKSPHVPYRNSKLTQVLQSSLGGQAKTLMFVQLNPDVDSYLETLSTLKFAERVSGVELGAARNQKEGRDIRELMEQVASLKDTITKKDEEIERLQFLKANGNGVKCGNSIRCASASPRRHSVGTPQQSPRIPRGTSSGHFQKVYSDMDNGSDSSEKHSEAGSLQSVDDFRHQKEFLPHSRSMVDLMIQEEFVPQPKLAETGDVGQSSKDDIELLGFGDADSEERLSDISDSCLSMGTETDGSLNSAVEFALFPESAKRSGASKPAKSASATKGSKPIVKVGKLERSTFASKLPKPPQASAEARLSHLSVTRSSNTKALSSMSAPRKITGVTGSSSAGKPSKRWH
uniref:Uncharacterized protein MANES_02G021900 n=2 Tax=Rhizophora mucronata TaxID=61149 RepID=A0A2P2JHT8_RHIMU